MTISLHMLLKAKWNNLRRLARYLGCWGKNKHALACVVRDRLMLLQMERELWLPSACPTWR